MAVQFMDSESYIENFDGGSRGKFDSQTDSSGSLLTFDHYSTLARKGVSPFSGDYVLNCTLSGSATSYLTEDGTGTIDGAATGETWFSNWAVCVDDNLTLTASDRLQLFVIRSASANEFEFGIRNNAGVYEFYIGQSAITNTVAFTRNKKRWYQFTATHVINAGAGTIAAYMDGNQIGGTLASLTNATFASMLFGILTEDETLNNTSGSVYLNHLIVSKVKRMYPQTRFGTSKTIFDDEVAFIGPCTLDAVHFVSETDNQTLVITDTDDSDDTAGRGSREVKQVMKVTSAGEVVPAFNTPIPFSRGIHCSFVDNVGAAEETQPRAAMLSVRGGVPVMSHANYVERGRKRKDNWAK